MAKKKPSRRKSTSRAPRSAQTPLHLIITPGDPEGVGPEIVLKALKKYPPKNQLIYTIIGAAKPFQKSMKSLIKQGIRFIEAPEELTPGGQSGWAVKQAVDILKNNGADALITGPVHKERLQKAGYPYMGHTEMLSALFDRAPATLMYANHKMRVSLVTTHLSLRDAVNVISPQKIDTTISQTIEYLRQYDGIKVPKIAVLGLNPHADEGGILGGEEAEIIHPVLERLRSLFEGQAEITGPHSADTFLSRLMNPLYKVKADAVVAMYHDQGMIPVKLVEHGKTIAITLGLPILRTSVDHGTAFDIAGKGIADPSSFIEAVEFAIRLAKNSRKHQSFR